MFDDDSICKVCGAETCKACHRKEARKIADAEMKKKPDAPKDSQSRPE